MKPKYRWTIFLAVPLGLVLVQCNLYGFLNSRFAHLDTKAATYPNPQTTVSETVTALGRIVPKDKIITLSGSSNVPNVGVAKILVQEGDKVRREQVIAILDNIDKLQATLKQAKQKLAVVQAQLMQVRAGQAKKGEIAAQEAHIDTLDAQFSGDISTQKANMDRLKAELLHQTDAQAAENTRLEAEWKHAQAECDRYETLFKSGVVSASTRESKCLEQETAKEQLNAGEANQKRIKETLLEQIKEAKANLNRTLSTYPKQITEAKANLNQIMEVRPVDVEVAYAELEQAKSAVVEAQTQLNSAYVRAPSDGQILKIYTFPGEKISNQGILDLAQTQQMYVVAEVYETEISKLRQGQLATISSGALKNKLQGTVEQISMKVGKKEVLNTDPTLNVDARVVEVKIRLYKSDNQQAAKMIDLEVEVQINTKS